MAKRIEVPANTLDLKTYLVTTVGLTAGNGDSVEVNQGSQTFTTADFSDQEEFADWTLGPGAAVHFPAEDPLTLALTGEFRDYSNGAAQSWIVADNSAAGSPTNVVAAFHALGTHGWVFSDGEFSELHIARGSHKVLAAADAPEIYMAGGTVRRRYAGAATNTLDEVIIKAGEFWSEVDLANSAVFIMTGGMATFHRETPSGDLSAVDFPIAGSATIIVAGGTFRWMGGTLGGNLYVIWPGILDFSQAPVAFTVTNPIKIDSRSKAHSLLESKHGVAITATYEELWGEAASGGAGGSTPGFTGSSAGGSANS
jgi:hypothetical protein